LQVLQSNAKYCKSNANQSNAGKQVMQSNAKWCTVMQKMQSNDLLKSNENNEDNAKVTAYINATNYYPPDSFWNPKSMLLL
jgi:hypothetical protein